MKYVVKLGGSLLSDLPSFSRLLAWLHDHATQSVFMVGSGPIGDAYVALGYNYQTRRQLNDIDSWSLLQSVNARLICEIDDRFVLCADADEASSALEHGRSPIIDALHFSAEFAVLEDQMSDVRAARIANYLGCAAVVIVTNVDGIFDSDPNNVTAAPPVRLARIRASDPLLQNRTSVDRGLAGALRTYAIPAYVVAAERVLSTADWDSVLKSATQIVPD